MTVLRRISALATGVLVLQLTLLGAAAPCTDHGVTGAAEATHGAGGPADGGHAQSGNATSAIATAAGNHEDCDGAPTESGRPESSGGECIAMVSCVAPMLQLGSRLVIDGVVVSARVAAGPLSEPPTRTTAPELPPPRA